MNLAQEWQNLSTEITAQDKVDSAKLRLDEGSHTLLQSLLFKLKWKIRWIRIINIPILIAALFVDGDLQLLLIFFFLTYEFGRFFGHRKLMEIKTGVDYNSSTKALLSANLQSIKSILKGETIWGWIFIPLSGPSGLLTYKLIQHQTFEKVFAQPNFFIQIAAVALISLPFIYIGKKMNDSIFAKHLQDLADKITQLTD